MNVISQLRRLVRDEEHEHGPQSCGSDAECGRGSCLRGRCDCPVDVLRGELWGGAHCERNNSEHRAAHPRYDESKYAKYYSAFVASSSTNNASSLSSVRAAAGSSGPGSLLNATFGIRAALPRILSALQIRTLVDVPCGDFQYMRAVLADPQTPRGIRYLGLDIVGHLVRALQKTDGAPNVGFTRFDLSTQRLWPVDLLVVRDVLFHFSPARALDILQNNINRSGARYLLSTYFPGMSNRLTGAHFRSGGGFRSFWKINLQDAPFSFPPPLLAIGHDDKLRTHGRVLGLWRLPVVCV